MWDLNWRRDTYKTDWSVCEDCAAIVSHNWQRGEYVPLTSVEKNKCAVKIIWSLTGPWLFFLWWGSHSWTWLVQTLALNTAIEVIWFKCGKHCMAKMISKMFTCSPHGCWHCCGSLQPRTWCWLLTYGLCLYDISLLSGIELGLNIDLGCVLMKAFSDQ